MPQNITSGVKLNLPQLTDSQKEAVFTLQGPILADAVPGSGKTRTITSRAAYLAASGRADQILAITFTKAARSDMSIRTRKLLVETDLNPKITHFHSFTYHLLKELRGVRKLPVVEPKIILNRAKTIYRQLSGEDEKTVDEKTIENFVGLISRAKSEGLSIERERELILSRFEAWLTRNGNNTDVPDFVLAMWDRLAEWYAEHNLLDFDDLLNLAVGCVNDKPDWRLTLHERFRHIMIDEFQDTNPPQWALIRSIVENRIIKINEANWLPAVTGMDWTNRSLLGCGDGDQSIYGFRSADVSNILQFTQVYENCRIVELKTNYRSSSTITECANDLIKPNLQRRRKVIEAQKGTGAAIGLLSSGSEEEMVEKTAKLLFELYNEKRGIGVLAKHNSSIKLIQDECAKLGIPTETSDGVPFSELRPVANIRRWLTAAADLHNSQNLLKAFAETGEQTLWRERLCRSRTFGISLFEIIWQEGDLSEAETEFLKFLLRISKLLTAGRFMEVLDICLDQSGLINDLAESNDPLKNGRMVDVASLFTKTETIETGSDNSDRFENFLELFENKKSVREKSSVKLMTIHASKGLEFDTVVIVDVNDGIMPDHSAEDGEEERRVAYVAFTRAKNRLVLCYNKHNPSRYIRELVELKSSRFTKLYEN